MTSIARNGSRTVQLNLQTRSAGMMIRNSAGEESGGPRAGAHLTFAVALARGPLCQLIGGRKSTIIVIVFIIPPRFRLLRCATTLPQRCVCFQSCVFFNELKQEREGERERESQRKGIAFWDHVGRTRESRASRTTAYGNGINTPRIARVAHERQSRKL